MNREDDHNISPATMGEVNLTLRYMQKTLDGQGALMKEVSAKVDTINSNTVPMSTFLTFQAHVDKIFATKDEVKPLVTIMWFIGGLIVTSIVGAVLKIILVK